MQVTEYVSKLPYTQICREEANFTAILYTLLSQPENMTRFLKLIKCEDKFTGQSAIFFEFAYIRDIWHAVESPKERKDIILDHLPFLKNYLPAYHSIEHFNKTFVSRASKDEIQSPSRWEVSKFNQVITNNSDFLKVCKFKWSFNIKPDLVIQLSNKKAICIEAKFESNEAVYPKKADEKKIFSDRKLEPIRQYDLQKYMMQELLGLNTQFVVIFKHSAPLGEHTLLTWGEIFRALDFTPFPQFIKQMTSKFL
ncbi:MAG: hypothetical protein L6Q47_04325 [Ignavibacteriaceae bacterium]|nr:hypothetical protein [Ignavibacteriaceae bacterium]